MAQYTDSQIVNLARAGDARAWDEALVRGLESRVLVNVNGKG
jgi:hypothetical protein